MIYEQIRLNRRTDRADFPNPDRRANHTNLEVKLRCLELSFVNTRQPVKSRTYNLLEFRAEEGETPPTCSVYSSSSSPTEPVHCGRCVGDEPTL